MRKKVVGSHSRERIKKAIEGLDVLELRVGVLEYASTEGSENSADLVNVLVKLGKLRKVLVEIKRRS